MKVPHRTTCLLLGMVLACTPALGAREAFTLTIENDAFGVFLPFSNQFTDVETPPGPYSGFVVQLGDALGSAHGYTHIDLMHGNRVIATLPREEVGWLDIFCGGNAEAITYEQAQLLVPLPSDPDPRLKLIHGQIALEPQVNLVTIFRDDTSLTVESVPGDEIVGGDHLHDSYVFSSPVACTVRVWPAWGATDPTPIVYDSADNRNQVTDIVIYEESDPTTHGPFHQPWWP